MKTAKNLNITDFMAAWFDGNYAVIGEGATREDFEAIKTDYIDMAGLYASKEFSMTYNLLVIENRINIIQSFMLAQRGYIETVGCPNLADIDLLRRFGHRLTWNGNKELFLMQLDKIELRENKVRSNLDILEKQLTDMKGKHVEVFVSQSTERKNFIRMIWNLKKNGYPIDKEKDSVEDLANAINMQREEYERMMMESKQGKAGSN